MQTYSFVTVWKLKAPLDAVWNAIRDSKAWPSWWKSVLEVREIDPGNIDGVGNVTDSAWRGFLPYTLRFRSIVTVMKPMVAMEGHTNGDLAGTGRWEFSHAGGITTVKYQWEVRTTSAWMNWLTPLLKGLFKWNHDVVMRRGGEGLAKKLGAELV